MHKCFTNNSCSRCYISTPMLSLAGFTVIELMVTVAIVGILLSVALPSYRELVMNNCLTTGANTLVSSLQFARSEAVKRKTNVTITAANTGDSQNEWGRGWTITVGSEVLRQVDLGCDQTTINETGNRSVFSYGSQGFINITGTFDLCDTRAGETGRQVSISSTGRPNTKSNYSGCI